MSSIAEENCNMSEAEICSPSAEQLLMHKVFADLRNWSADFVKLECHGDFAGLKIMRQWRSMPNISSGCRVDVVSVQASCIHHDKSTQTETVLSDLEIIQNTVPQHHPITAMEELAPESVNKRNRPSRWKRTKRFFVRLFTR
ncbi:unnamed protein product [Macrosiphum euphorbiae]|uniref:Uncharacterized protein n=1 Tax=Macrosiphum euphorbiae TaxID=13131 RepID=A0AAV0XDD7_9HEMI|nr:unnamed protein product [Macrosiphum euphorbiae]